MGELDLDKLLRNQLITGGIGTALGFVGNLLGGDGGQGKRIREAQGVGRGLLNASFNPGAIAQQRQAFQRGVLNPRLNNLAGLLASRVGLDSGIGAGTLLNQGADLSAAFENNAIQSELERVLRQKLAGANILGSLAR